MRIIINEKTDFKCEFKSWKEVALRFIKVNNMTYRIVKEGEK
jgi:hypothetical protein